MLGVSVLFALVGTGCVTSDVGPQDFMTPEGPIARRSDSLWNVTFAIAAVVFVIVQGLLVYAIVKFRHRPGRQAAQFHGNTKMEVALTLIPALILAGLAIPTVKAIADLSEKPDGALNITVMSYAGSLDMGLNIDAAAVARRALPGENDIFLH